MSTLATPLGHEAMHPAQVHVVPTIDNRNRLTVALRPILAIPHLILVGGPLALTLWWIGRSDPGDHLEVGSGGGLIGAAAVMVAIIAWFAIVFTRRCPDGLWRFAAYYLRWRVRAVAYFTMLRDEYPPFGDGDYPARLELAPPDATRDRVTVGFRWILVIPQLIAVWAIGIAWALASIIAWFAILFTGRYPAGLYHFAVGALRWSTRVEAYLLLLHDEYPPFELGEE